MKREHLTVTIGPDGGIEVEAQNSVGRGCEALTAAFEEELGTKTSTQKKPEWNRDAKQPRGQQAGQ